MASIPFAFSVHHFINSVGAYAGFAAIIGLAILVLLYFAQARETSSLREQLYEAAQRMQMLENRLMQLSRMPAAPPVQAQPGVPARPVGTPAVAPAAAGGRRNRRHGARHPGHRRPGGRWGTGAHRGHEADPGGGAVVAGAEAFHGAEPDLTTVGAPAPATVAGGANGHTTVPPPPIAAPTSPQQGATDPGTMAPPPRIQIRPGAAPVPPGRRPAPPSRKPPKQGPSTARRVVLGLLGLLVIAGVVVALLVLTSSNGNKTNTSTQAANTSKTTSTATNSHRRKTQTAAFSPSSVTVSVLNGTATAQLAHRVATKLSAVGYKEGTVATAADQTRTATVVAYLPGRQRDALAVAKSLKLGPASVQPIDQSTQAVACPPGTPCSAGVVVTVGSDLASIQ